MLAQIKELDVWDKYKNFEISSVAMDGYEALNLLVQNSYDLVILEIQLPFIDGLALLRRRREVDGRTLFVLTSEVPAYSYARQGIILGAFDYLIAPITNSDLEEILHRAQSILTGNNHDDINEIDLKLSEMFKSKADIMKLISGEKPKALMLFRHVVSDIYKSMGDDFIRADYLIKQIYSSFIDNIFNHFTWLDKFVKTSKFYSIDNINEKFSKSYENFYANKLNELFGIVTALHPAVENVVLNQIFDYILENIDENIMQKQIAEKFFLSASAVSSMFQDEIGRHFKDYITMIKMQRSEFLILNTDYKIYEISSIIGYKDSNYFVRIFKEKYGVSPSVFRNAINMGYNI